MTTPLLIDGADGLRARVGQTIATGKCHSLRFEDMQALADATGDHQWIHVDRERAARESPFGAPVAHGYWTLARMGGLLDGLGRVSGFSTTVNHGLQRTRFPAPLREGDRYRLLVELLSVSDIEGGLQAHDRVITEIDGQPKPAMVAEPLFRYYGAA